LSFSVYIPARYGSTRLPGKPLCDLAGKPLIRHVFERAVESGADTIIIATDDERIRACAEGFGAKVCMTSADHTSGTDRIAEAAALLGEEEETVIVDLQVDEPCMPAQAIRQVAGLMGETGDAEMATLCVPLLDPKELFDPQVAKVVLNRQGHALYFSRAPIPWHRDGFIETRAVERLPAHAGYYRHIGLYAYRAGFLQRFSRSPVCPLEQVEHLEQLRALYYGFQIRIAVAEVPVETGIDTPYDLERIRRLFVNGE
jgi:3-deoxy-manno-octulosonate cytidylyltransferase (CMP-KDO synthetase)